MQNFTQVQSNPLLHLGGRNEISPGDYESVSYSFQGYSPTYGDDGELLPCAFWPEADILRTGTLTLDEGLHLEEIRTDSANDDYYLQIVVEDVYGAQHASELIKMP